MGCGGCGGGFDPYAAYRNGGQKFMGIGSSEGVIKSEENLKKAEKGEVEKEIKVKEVKAAEHPEVMPVDGVIKSEKRLAQEAKEAEKNKAFEESGDSAE